VTSQRRGRGSTAIAPAARPDGAGGLYARQGLVQGVATSVFMFTTAASRASPRHKLRYAWLPRSRPFPSDLHQAFDDCKTNLYFYYEEDGGCLFKTEPNPNKVLSDRAGQRDHGRGAEPGRARGGGGGRPVEPVSTSISTASPTAPSVSRAMSLTTATCTMILPSRLTVARGKLAGKAAEVVPDVDGELRQEAPHEPQPVLFLAPDAEYISGAVEGPWIGWPPWLWPATRGS